MKRLWIPFFFMLLAAIACDSPYYDLPRILGVQADAQTAGRVYAEVGTAEAKATYVSSDYGRTWQPSDEPVETGYDERFSMRGDDLYRDGARVWSFPRPQFRFFFLDDANRQHFALPLYSQVSASQARGVLYVGMGTEGVLTFTDSGDTSSGDWYLSAAGITQLKPLPLTITHAPTLASIIALALLIPPLPLLHAYLLSRVWLYAVPGRKAWRAALLTTLAITVLAALAIVFWLTNASTDYYPVVAIMTVITVFAGVGATLLLAPQQQAWKLARRAGLVSLIVPAGVASIWWGWLIIIPLVSCYAIYRWIYARLLKKSDEAAPRIVDWLALRSLGLFSFAALLILILIFGVDSLRVGSIVLIPAGILAVYFTVRLLTNHMEKVLLGQDLKSKPLRRTISAATILCYVLAPVLAFIVFMGQGYAHSWFTTLLVSR